MDQVISKSIIGHDFQRIVVDGVKRILESEAVKNRAQRLIVRGQQTAGNIFATHNELANHLSKLIDGELRSFLNKFKYSTEGLIRYWPEEYHLNGWIVSMKSGGTINPHIHENGWMSGSIYINVPESKGEHDGSLVVCIDENVIGSKDQKFNAAQNILDVKTGSLCLFPSSLIHYTLPFTSPEDRIVLAFDVIPGRPNL